MNFADKIKSLKREQRLSFLERVNKEGEAYGVYPLTENQYLFWCNYQRSRGEHEYSNPTFRIKIQGKVTQANIRSALHQVIENNDVLRYRFIEMEGQCFQYFVRDEEISIPIISLRKENELKKVQRQKEEELDFRKIPFNLEKDFPLHIRILELNAESYVILVSLHHIISDAWSVGIFARQFIEILAKGNQKLEKNPWQFGNYAFKCHGEAQQKKREEAVAYWIELLKPLDKYIDLPTDFFPGENDNPGVGLIQHTMDKETHIQLEECIRFTRSNPYVLFSSIFSLVLSAFANKKDFLMATTLFNREGNEDWDIIGDFATIIPLDFHVKDELSIEEYIRQCMKNFLKRMEFGDIVINRLVDAFPTERWEDSFPLYQTAFVYHSGVMLGAEGNAISGDFDVAMEDLVTEENLENSNLDLIVEVLEENGKITITAEFAKKKFRVETIEKIMEVYFNLLERLPYLLEEKIGKVKLTESNEILESLEYKGTQARIVDSAGNCVPEHFFGEVQVRKNYQWEKTGKKGRVKNGQLYIDQNRSSMISLALGELDIGAGLKQLKESHQEMEIGFRVIENNFLVYNWGSSKPLSQYEVEEVLGTSLNLLYHCKGKPYQKELRHMENVLRSMSMLKEKGYKSIATQPNVYTDDVLIVFQGEKAAAVSEVEEIREQLRDNALQFVYSQQDPKLIIDNSDELEKQYRYPQKQKSTTQIVLMDIWQEVLGHDNFDIYDNFYEIGGSSVKVLQLMHKMEDKFEISMSIADLFVYNTVEDLAGYVEKTRHINDRVSDTPVTIGF